jgi:hypothetical protein
MSWNDRTDVQVLAFVYEKVLLSIMKNLGINNILI